MQSLLKRLWNDDLGAIITIEMLFLFVILTLGLIAGWTNLQAAINTQLTEQANAILALNDGFVIAGAVGCNSQNGSGGTATTQTIQTIGWTFLCTATPACLVTNITVTACP